MNKHILFAITVLFCLPSCTEKPTDTPTYGSIRVSADETLYPVIDAQERMFEHTYKNAHIDIAYLPESQAFQELLADSVRLVVAARQLTPQEIARFEQVKITPVTTKIATDAIALITHKDNPDSTLTYEAALRIFKGELLDWKQITPENQGGSIHLVFDHSGSSTVTYILKKTGQPTPPANSYALKTNEAVVEYVATHPGALGIIGYNWLSDYDDPQSQKLRSMVRVVAISPFEGDFTGHFYKPFASNLLNYSYPFGRDVYIISRESRTGLGTGFCAYVAGEIGQRIILKSGILPAYKVDHNIELKSEPFRVKQ